MDDRICPGPLLELLKNPAGASSVKLFGTLAMKLNDQEILPSLPKAITWQIEAGCRQVDFVHRQMMWELDRLERALFDCNVPVILLKGAAYLAAGLNASQGRISNDVDILVPLDQLKAIEQLLLGAGWGQESVTGRHAEYYRRWLHELPPLKHPVRCVELDVHHNLIPATDPLCPDPIQLWDECQSVLEQSRFKILSARDLVIHASCHLFRNSPFDSGLRDLWDIYQLVGESESPVEFLHDVMRRAKDLRLGMPVGLALTNVARYLVSKDERGDWLAVAKRGIPFWFPLRTMNRIVHRAIYPRSLKNVDKGQARAGWILSHYPPPRIRAMLTPLFWLKRWPEKKDI